jgi:hypothetical protein
MSRAPDGTALRRRAWSWRRRVLVGLALIFLVIVGWVGIRGALAVGHLRQVPQLAQQLQGLMLDGDLKSSRSVAEELQGDVGAARSLTDDAIWRAVEFLPLVGDDLRAVRQVSGALSNVVDGTVMPVVEVASTFGPDAFRPRDGVVDLAPLKAAGPELARADVVLKEELLSVGHIDVSGTVRPLKDNVETLMTTLGSLSSQVDSASRAVDLVPAMMGEEGPRNYVVLFQNNAELRSTGGIPGALALVTVSDGRVELAQQASSGDFPRAESPVLPLPVDTRGLYGDITGQYIQDVNLTPQFPLSAELASTMWTQRFGTSVDGVVSLDPVALSFLLTATGPVELPTGETLTAENVVPLLLSETYSRYPDSGDQDKFFAAAATSVFAAVTTGDLDARALLSALSRAGDERRLYLWSSRPDEQIRLAETSLAGALPTSTDEEPRAGVYFNDGTGGKMDYYLHSEVNLGQAVCRRDGRSTYVIEVTLRNDAPADAATSLPDYVTGAGAFGVAPGDVSTNVAIYAPSEGVFVAAVADGQPAAAQTALDSELSVVQYQTTLSPGESTTWRVQFLGGESAVGDLEVEKTPTVNLTETNRMKISCEDPLT